MNGRGVDASRSPESGLSRPSSSLLSFFLWICLIIGLCCRFYGLNWDEGLLLHPDERHCVTVAGALNAATSMGQFFDSRVSPLNPFNHPDIDYVYGQLPLFLLKIATNLAPNTNIVLVGRFLSAFFDCGTVLLTLLIARRVFDGSKPVLAAALVACAALHLQQSHFFVTDTFAAFFITASFWAASRAMEGRARDAVLAGLFFGAALACKISAALFVTALLGFLVWSWRQNGVRIALIGGVCCFGATMLAFRMGHPMGFRGEGWSGFFDLRPEPRFWNSLGIQGAITRGDADVPFNVQWIGRRPWLFSLQNLGFWGYGWPFLLSAISGAVVLLRRPKNHSLLLVATFFALVLLGIQGAAFSKFSRYYLPLTPLCALLAAYFWAEAEQRDGRWQFGTGLTAFCALLWTLAVASIYGRTHSRIAASRWLMQNLPPGTTIINETSWDESLPLGGLPEGDGGFKHLPLETFDLDTPYKRADMIAKLDAANWICLSSGRSWQNVPRWSEKWPLTTEFYRVLFDGKLGFKLVGRWDSFPQLGPYKFPDANAEEALTVFDHPLVLLFHKTPRYNSRQTRRLLNAVPLPTSQSWIPRLAPLEGRDLPVPPTF